MGEPVFKFEFISHIPSSYFVNSYTNTWERYKLVKFYFFQVSTWESSS